MSDLDQPPRHQPTAPQSVHARVIQDRLPRWYERSALKRKEAFSQTQFVMPPWYAALSPARQSVLSVAYARSFDSLNRLDDIFNGLQGVIAFAEPLLVAAMKQKFSGNYDVKRLFFAREAFMPADRSKVSGLEASGYCYYQGESLLEAALGNFALEDTIDVADKNASLVTRYDFHQQPPHSTFNQSEVLRRKVSIAPHVFASLCRELDLGAQYLAHVESFISPLDPPRAATGSRARAVRNLMVSATRNQLQFAAEVAVVRGDIHQDAFELIQRLMSNQQALEWRGKAVTFSSLNFLGQPLEQVIVIGHVNIYHPVRGNVVFLPEPCLAFIPGDPVCMLKEYTDLAALKFDLIERLCMASYRQFFSQFIPYERQGAFFVRLKQHLDPTAQFEEFQDFDSSKKNIRTLPASYGTRYALLWQDHARKKIDLMCNNARAMAVSTDAADIRARNAWLVKLGSTALNVLNAAVLVFPELTPIILMIGAVQMLREVASGIEAWEEGDKQAAWAHVSAIALNVTTAVVGAKLIPWVNSAFVESLAHVRCPDGNIRLHVPDLRPYQQSVSIPAGLTVNGDGLIEHGGGLYLLEDNAYYRVEQVGAGNDYKILHPRDPTAFTPRVSRTRAGAWAHEHENPMTLTDSQLMRRLGPMAERFADKPLKLERIVQMSGTHMDALRKMHADKAPLPALLSDTLKRFELDSTVAQEPGPVNASQRAAYQSELFAQRYAASQNVGSDAARLIKRVFPSLPKAVIEELLDGATDVEMKSLIEHNRVPLRLLEEARHYQQQVRLAQAYEGLYRKTLGNNDTQRLVLHSLDKLPGWPSDLRIEIVERLPVGERLLDSLGPENASVKRRFIKFGRENLYEVQNDRFAVLNPQADIYGAIQSAVSPQDWQAMELIAHDRGASLKQVLEQRPLMPRDELREVLRMQPVKPRYKPPMRLADGRFGYPLSPIGAAGRRPWACERAALELYPSRSIAQVEQMLGLQEVGDFEFMAKMDELKEQLRQLKADLDTWRADGEWHQRRARGRVAVAIQDAWQRRPSKLIMTPEQEHMTFIMRLCEEHVGELPAISANMDHVDCLDLSNMYLSDASLPFLRAFGGLRWLDISHSNFTRLPEFANDGASLTWLDLSGNDIRLTAQTQAQLEGMQRLTTLNLSNNPHLGWTADLSNLRDLNRLNLANTGTTTFPTGAEQLNNLAWIDLHTNAITQLPEYAVENSDRINVHENPVSEVVLSDDHVTRAEARRLWLHDSPPALQASRGEMWDQLSASPESAAFFTVVADTTRCAEYTSGITRPQLAERVWDMLEAVHENQKTRGVLFTSADRRVTCGDGSALEFMNLEIDLLVEKALGKVGEHEVEATLIGTAERLFRLKLVDIIAQRDVEARGPAFAEQAEVILAYRTSLAQRLDLPVKSVEMLHRPIAGVSAQTLDAAYVQVLEGEKNIGEKSHFFVDMEFWRNQLRAQYLQELNALTMADFELITEKREALETVADLQKTRGDAVEQDARSAWQREYEVAVDRVASLLDKSRDQILVDGSMTSAFYNQEMKQLGAQRQSSETTAMQALTVTVLERRSANEVASL